MYVKYFWFLDNVGSNKKYLLACENQIGQKCNAFGTNVDCGLRNEASCGQGSQSQCKVGYKGLCCELCAHGYYTLNVTNRIDDLTNEGAICNRKLLN